MEKVSTFSIIISILLLTVILLEVLIKLGESHCRKKSSTQIIEGLPLPNKRKIYLDGLCKREEVAYVSYLLYNALYFVDNFLSLEYSIATIAALLIYESDLVSKIWMPLITMTFTVVNICIKPQHRANQYLLAWRKYDTHKQLLLQKNYATMSDDDISDTFEESILYQSKIEESLKYDVTEND